jgi:hypothetical protein
VLWVQISANTGYKKYFLDVSNIIM